MTGLRASLARSRLAAFALLDAAAAGSYSRTKYGSWSRLGPTCHNFV
jgi:hypothetical protein